MPVRLALVGALALLLAAPAHASGGWFDSARLGLFVHYGPSTLVNAPDTPRWWAAVDSPSFPSLAARFQPRPGVTREWVALALRAHATYLTVTVKHHDGYALWDSRLTRYDVGPRHDLLRTLAPACRRAGIRLVLYYSLLDLHQASYASDWPRYIAFVEGQLRELLTRYGPIAGIWFDGPPWALPDEPLSYWRLSELYDEIHALQPDAVVITNHHQPALLPGEDVQTFEQELPTGTAPWPRETAWPLRSQWFYSTRDAPRSHDDVLALEARAQAAGASLVLDVPPRADGTFDPADVRALLGRSDR